MSRSGGGPRRDLQVLKRLKEASSNPSLLLQDGNGILEKANKIKGFLSKQKSRTTAATGKSEWLLVYQHLQEERETCERELTACLSQLLDCGSPELSSEAKDCLASCRATAEQCRVLRGELKLQVKGISKVAGSLRACSGKGGAAQEFRRECDTLNQEVRMLREDLQLQLQQLTEEHDTLSAELAALPPTLLSSNAAAAAAAAGHGVTGSATSGSQAGDGAGASSGAAADAAEVRLVAGEATADGLGTVAGAAGGAFAYSTARDASELEALLAKYPLADEGVRRSVREVHQALQERFLEKLATWRAEWEMSGLAATKAGWSPEEQSQFVKLRERYFKDQGTTAKGGRQAAFTRMAPLLPGRTVQELLVYDDLFVASRLLQRRRRDAVEAWGRERRCFLADTECFLEESARANAAAAAAAADRLAHELMREQLHEDLDGQRAARLAEWEAGSEARAAAEQEAREKAQAEAERAEKERALRKDMIAAYRAELDERIQQEQAEKDAAEREAARLRAQQLEAGKERVEWRHAEYQLKVEKQQEHHKQQQEEELARQQRLDRLRALVAPQVEIDPQRVLAPTAAYEAAKAALEEERDQLGAAAFRPVHGYNVNQLYKDPRFKLMDALQRQGLHNTDYGRHMLLNTQAARPTRPDNLTHLQQKPAQSHR